MPTSGHLDLTKDGKPVVQKVYCSMIGSLLYLCPSHPDIMLSVCKCARYQAAPKECHLKAMKRIVRYLIHTPNFGIWYPKRSSFDLVGYSIQTMPVTRLIESPLRVHVNFLVDLLCLGVMPPIQSYTNHARKCVRSSSGTHGKISQHNATT